MWQFVFWACVATIAYSYIGYPLILFVISKLRRPRAAIAPLSEEDYPTVCLIISAYNEEKVLRKKIENSLDLDYPSGKLTVCVASDGSDDGTVSIANEYREQGVMLYHRSERSGKSAVLNEVVKELDQDVVVFTDANTFFEKAALLKLVRHFQDSTIGCVVGKLRYVDRHTTAVGKSEGVYWRYEGKISVLESSLRNVLVANGSIFGIRRTLFVELYPEVANDFQMPLDISNQGYAVVYEPEAVALERATIFWHEEFERKVRIVLQGLSGFVKLRRKYHGFKLWQFVSHKLVRWFVGPLMFVALLANAILAEGSAFYAVVLGLQLLLVAAAIGGWRTRRSRRPHPFLYLPAYFIMVNVAAVIAMSRYLSGERLATWDKAESARFAPARTRAVPRRFAAPVRLPTGISGESEPEREKVAKTQG